MDTTRQYYLNLTAGLDRVNLAQAIKPVRVKCLKPTRSIGIISESPSGIEPIYGLYKRPERR